jgi:hypothetical protein
MQVLGSAPVTYPDGLVDVGSYKLIVVERARLPHMSPPEVEKVPLLVTSGIPFVEPKS